MTPRQRIKQRLEWAMANHATLPPRQFNLRCCELLEPGVMFHPGSDAQAEIDRMDAHATLGRLFAEVRNNLRKL